MRATWYSSQRPGIDAEIQRTTNSLALQRLMLLSMDEKVDYQARAIAFDAISELDNWLSTRVARENDRQWRAHYRLARYQIERVRQDPASLETLVPVMPPPGSPVGDSVTSR
jgi:hypothetical protein